jgi:NADH-quinone oxidoreductase subunit I
VVQLVRKVYSGIKNLIIGLFTTGKHLGRHAITVQYPTERWPMPERSRGIVVLLSDKETGELNCTTCLLCMRACPTAAIRIDYDKDEKGKRILKDFVVDQGMCCFCGLCEEACNFAALKMATKYEFATYNSEDLIWHTDKLQEVGRDVPYEKPQRKKPEVKPAAPKPAPAPNPAPAPEKKPETKDGSKPEGNNAN